MGLWGLLGSGNFGNDGSVTAMVAFLRNRHPNARLGFFCTGPERVAARYGIPATHMQWYDKHAGSATGIRAIPLKAVGKVLGPIRTLAWLRRYDVVFVPGAGVLEASLPMRPWGFPLSLLSLCALGKLVGTRVALVSVGADVIRKRTSRWMITRAARFASYRSYRDTFSRDSMRAMGVDVASDEVYPDLAFALPVPPVDQVAPRTVGVGVMAYYGGNDDRGRAAEIHRAYVDTMERFVCWLVDNGRRVRLFGGDEVDASVISEIRADVRARRPGLDLECVLADPVSSLDELMRQMASVETVVATRYHNVLCALRLAKPTLSVGYGPKNDVLMASMGLGQFCQSARVVDLERLIGQFGTLERQRDELVDTMRERNRNNARCLEEQFAALSAILPKGDTASLTVETPFHAQEVS